MHAFVVVTHCFLLVFSPIMGKNEKNLIMVQIIMSKQLKVDDDDDGDSDTQ